VLEKHPFYCFEAHEKIRTSLMNDNQTLDITDLGTGTTQTRTIASIAAKALKPAAQAQLLFRICARYGCRNVLELGTSLGITTLYLSAADKAIRCITVEGCPVLAQQASQQLQSAGYPTTRVININLDTELIALLKKTGPQDLIFIDANHRYEALMNYFNHCVNFIHTNSIIVVDDPYWSAGMTKAWKELKHHPAVAATIDLYHMGIVFFNPEFSRKHYRVRF
jgi:predicted O-methyltransferase YrrM